MNGLRTLLAYLFGLVKLYGKLSRVGSRSKGRKLTSLFLLRSVTALLDPLAVILLGLTVNLVLIGPETLTDQNRQVYALFGISGVEDAPQRLRLMVSFGCLVVVLFVVKSIASLALLKAITGILADLEVDYSHALATKVFQSRNIGGQGAALDNIVYCITTGVNSLYQRGIGAIGLLIADLTLMLATVVVLCAADFTSSLVLLLFFALVTLLIQKSIGSRMRRIGLQTTAAQIKSHTSLRDFAGVITESILAGTSGAMLDSFKFQKKLAAKGQAQAVVYSQIPRYILETSLIISGFAVAAYLFKTKDFYSASTLLAIFMAAGSRLIPSLVSILSTVTDIRNASGDILRTIELEKRSSGSV